MTVSDELAELRAEVAALRARIDGSAEAAPSDAATAGPLTRRQLFGRGAAGAAAAGAILVAGSRPAAAIDPNDLDLGLYNATSSVTRVDYTGGFSTAQGSAGMMFQSGTTYDNASAFGSALAGFASPTGNAGAAPMRFGVEGYTAAIGEGAGVLGRSDGGTAGVVGLSGSNQLPNEPATGVFGRGIAETGACGVAGVAGVTSGGGGATGVQGRATGPSGVGGSFTATDANGIGVFATGVYGAIVAGSRCALALGYSAPGILGGQHGFGELVQLDDGRLMFCVQGGSVNTVWQELGGPTSAGALHVLPSPVRALDTRTTGGALPGNGTARTVSLAAAVPAGATAALVNVTCTETGPTGFVAMYSAAVPFPGTSTINWSQPGTNIANTTVTAVDAQRRVKLQAGSSATHVILDVIGWYG